MRPRIPEEGQDFPGARAKRCYSEDETGALAVLVSQEAEYEPGSPGACGRPEAIFRTDCAPYVVAMFTATAIRATFSNYLWRWVGFAVI